MDRKRSDKIKGKFGQGRVLNNLAFQSENAGYKKVCEENYFKFILVEWLYIL